MSPEISFRFAEPRDVPAILRLIRLLASYEDAEDAVETTPELLQEALFEKGIAEALVVEHAQDGVVGCAVFFRNFSTWTGRGGMYLEDLFIEEGYRGGGVGHALLEQLAQICEDRGWARMDWACLDWNSPSLGFYKSVGAHTLDEWIHHRLGKDGIRALAGVEA